MSKTSQHFEVAIVGTGFSGLGMAIRLKKFGQPNFVILERASELGGTWRDNLYPGCACDIPSYLYSFSFAQNPNWTRLYPSQPEIYEYLKQTAEHYGLLPHIRFETPLLGAAWDEKNKQWQISTPHGPLTANVLILGNGPLSEPSLPNILGLAGFEGKLFHSAQWDHSFDLKGKRVGVIGTGASAIQFVPEIQPEVERLTLFQRTPPWIVPRGDHPISEKQRRFFKKFPLAQTLERIKIYWQREFLAVNFLYYNKGRSKLVEQIGRKHLQSQVPDPTLRDQLTPEFAIGCKRILVSDNFYPTLTQPNIEVVSENIAAITPTGIKTTKGKEYSLDTIICGTGFQATDSPLFNKIRGRRGRYLSEVWHEGMRAYLGTAVPGFPNMFMLIGPNTGLGHNSMVLMIESQIKYILGALQTMKKENFRAIEVRPEVSDSYNRRLQVRLKGTVWNSGCKSWYQDRHGHNTTIWPGFTFSFRRMTRHFRADKYISSL